MKLVVVLLVVVMVSVLVDSRKLGKMALENDVEIARRE